MPAFVGRRSLAFAAAALGSLSCTSHAQAQASWPERPVRIVVPFPPGGSTDIVARFLAEAMRERLGQPFLVENRSGAGGNVGTDYVAKSGPDGHTLVLNPPGPFAINEYLYRSMPFDPIRDIAPVALVASVPIVLMVPNSSLARSVSELIALAKREPGKMAFGSSSVGGTNHLAGELLRSLADIDIVHVPYRGAAPAMTDLIAGRLQIYFDNMPGVLPQVREGRVRALAVAGSQRARAMPDLPTVAEAGVPGFEASSWFGLGAAGTTPPALLARITREVRAAMQETALLERLADVGAEPGTLFGADFARFVAAEREKWGRLVQASGARAD
ncbi:tripartite tricarboxylate transporter substrate binding protein [Roseomonas sp. CAU 1739]|uniref:Bug family tripartite tricarboxylate transporter substrate binding protein n=1 Tax=Roseomonas sp. CAU 1739 TaxID=3140364 RepID=UPI00325C06E2